MTNQLPPPTNPPAPTPRRTGHLENALLWAGLILLAAGIVTFIVSAAQSRDDDTMLRTLSVVGIAVGGGRCIAAVVIPLTDSIGRRQD